jgi:molybdopterin/thiamine biosynthesis adenylyltransferase
MHTLLLCCEHVHILNRQFLFREAHIGKPKSHTAAAAAKGINPELNVVAHELKCASETENVFNDDFYSKLSGVCTALDNVEARLYMDQVSTNTYDTDTTVLTTMLFSFVVPLLSMAVTVLWSTRLRVVC